MKVKRGSWHYKLVRHKYFVREIENLGFDKEGEAVDYIFEVSLGVWWYIEFLLGLFLSIALFTWGPKVIISNYINFLIGFLFITTYPFWFMILFYPILKFLIKLFNKDWLKLEILI